MHIIVKTTGDFDLQNPADGIVVPHDGAAVVQRLSSFIQVHLAAKNLEIVQDEVPEGMTNDEFQELLVEAEGDVELALAGFSKPAKTKGKSKAEKAAEKEAAEKAAAEAAEKEAAEEAAAAEAAEKEAAEKAAAEDGANT